MKRYQILFICMFILTGTACKKQLNTLPSNFVSSVNYYTNLIQLQQGLAGVYDVLGDPSMYQEALLGHMSHTNDEGLWITAYNTPPSDFTYTSSDVNFTNLWNALYRGINNANIILEALSANNASSVAQSDKDNIRAQLLFLRAYYYLMLADRWGGVPLHLTSTKTASNTNFLRTPLEQVYQQIIDDMTIAESLLPPASTLGANSSGRLSKNAAQGMLARVCLSVAGFPLNDKTKYADALKWSAKLINAGENSLNPSYSDLFVKQARDEYYVKENIWEVEFYGNVTDNYREQGFVGVRDGLAAINGTTFPGYGYGFLQVPITLYNLYQRDATTTLSKDLRRDRNIATYQWIGGTAANQVMTKSYFERGKNLYERWPGKWRRDEEILLPRFKNGNGTNFPLLRYADVLLMFAEAENQVNGPTEAAYRAINLVRERAYGLGYRVNNITVTNGGSGYTAAPIVSIDNSGDPNGASTACAYATVESGKVNAVTLVSQGAFYTATPPNVTITSSNGVGSEAKAATTVQAIIPSEADLTPGLSQPLFQQAIIDERTKELAFECLRSHDLKRWNILIPTIQNLATYSSSAPTALLKTYYAKPGANITSRHLYYPIPPSEMATNALMTQNPEW